METPVNKEHGPRAAWLDELPIPVAAVALVISIIEIFSLLAPARMLRKIWRLVELSPFRLSYALEKGDIVAVIRPYLGYMFFHINLAHFLMNLSAILAIGTFVYRDMEAACGPRKSDPPAAFFAFFLFSGLAAGFVFAALNPKSMLPILGASGAAAGLFGAAIWIAVMRPDEDGQKREGVRAAAILFFASLNLVMVSYLLDTSFLSKFLFNSASAWQAHAGGYVFGLLSYPLFERMAGSSR